MSSLLQQVLYACMWLLPELLRREELARGAISDEYFNIVKATTEAKQRRKKHVELYRRDMWKGRKKIT